MPADVVDTLKKMTVEALRPIVSQVLGEDVVIDSAPLKEVAVYRSGVFAELRGGVRAPHRDGGNRCRSGDDCLTTGLLVQRCTAR